MTTMRPLFSATVSCVLLSACSAADTDTCRLADEHLQRCFPGQAPGPIESCDPALAENLLQLGCQEIAQGAGKTDWWCTPWTWWLCDGGTGGVTRTLAYSQDYPYELVQDSSHLYWTNYNPSADIMKAGKDGTGEAALASGQDRPSSIAVNDTHVFWIATTGDYTRAIRSVAKTGGAVTTLLDHEGGLYLLAADSTQIYFGAKDKDGDRGVYRLAIDTTGAKPELLCTNDKVATTFAMDDTYLYFGEMYGKGALVRVPKTGGACQTLAADEEASSIALHGDHLYYADDEKVVRLKKDGGGTPEELGSAGSYSAGGSLAVNGTHIYWTEYVGDKLWRMPLAGGEPETFASENAPKSLVLDADALYWLDVGRFWGKDYVDNSGSVKKKSI